jgi:hypothetical protein
VVSKVADPPAGLVRLSFGGFRSGAPFEAITDVAPAARTSAMHRTTSWLGERRVRIIVRDEGEHLGGGGKAGPARTPASKVPPTP